MRTAFLFPGQGAKRVHEALRFVARSEAGRARCEAAARAAEVPLDRLIARPSLLDRTEVLQPVLAAIALAIVEALAEQGIAPDIALGHSAGEIAAWAGAGGIAIEDALALAALRGRLMAREAVAHPGGMVALATSDPIAIEAALAAGRSAGALCLAARNAPDETVLSGDEAAVRAVLAQAPSLATRVPTSGAWHSPAMNGALDEWRRALAAVPRRETRCTFVANRTGDVVATPIDEIPTLLAEQLVRPVEWAKALSTVRERADVIVTLGPGAVLRALWHRNFRSSTGDRPAHHRTADEEEGSQTISRSPADVGAPPHGRAAGGEENGRILPRSPADVGAPPHGRATGTDDDRRPERHDTPSSLRGAGPSAVPDGAGVRTTSARAAAVQPQTLRLFATEDERALGETIAALRGLR